MIPKLSPRLESFIGQNITSFVKWDIIVFFSGNRDAADTAEALASRLGRKQHDVERALEELAEAGLLVRESGDGASTYRFSPPEHLASTVDDFVSALESREKRLQILTMFLRMGAR